jgi:hypothetical protein
VPMLKFTLTDHHPIWIDPDKVVAVGMNMSFGGGGAPGARIYLDIDNGWSVQESVEDVVAKIEKAKDRP